MRKQSKNKFLFVISIITAVFLFVVVLAPPVLIYYSVYAFEDNSSTETKIMPVSNPDDFFSNLTKEFGGNRINILLIGLDHDQSRKERGEDSLPDTIMIASFKLHPAEVNLVNIPRDSYVRIYDPDGREIYDKINHSFRHGYRNAADNEDPHERGLETTLKTIEDFLGDVSLSGYVALNMDGAMEIVDSMGGLYYEVDVEVRSHLGTGRLQLEEGYQHLDGRKFVDYIRNRAEHQGGESKRIERQQDIMIALFDQFKRDGRLFNLPGIYRVISSQLETDMNIGQIGALGLLGMTVNPDNIETFVFGGSGQLSYQHGQNIWYLVIDEKARVDTIEEVFGVTVDKNPQISLPGPYNPESEDETD